MRQKASKQICTLNDKDLFSFIAEGIPLIFQNSALIEEGAQSLLTAGNIRGARILRAVSQEEAAKCLILMDVVRCPRNENRQFSIQLSRFSDHLAKGIYALSSTWESGNLGMASSNIESLCKEHYLDGPNGYDWMFPNEVTSERENVLYVDCIENDDGTLDWLSPERIDKVYESFLPDPTALDLSQALIESGFCSSNALEIIAKRWRNICPDDKYHRSSLEAEIDNTYHDLDKAKLLKSESESLLPIIRHHWFFPLWHIDLKKITVDVAELRKEQENWLMRQA